MCIIILATVIHVFGEQCLLQKVTEVLSMVSINSQKQK